MGVSEKNKEFVNKVINTIDWGLILKFYKMVGRGTGYETTQIPGIKKIPASTITKEDIRKEVLCIVTYVIENDKSEFFYGPWDISWINGEWEVEINSDLMEREDEEETPIFMPILESSLEISFSPMFVSAKEMVMENYDPEESSSVKKDIGTHLEEELEKSLNEENYELASKLRDIILIYKNKK